MPVVQSFLAEGAALGLDPHEFPLESAVHLGVGGIRSLEAPE